MVCRPSSWLAFAKTVSKFNFFLKETCLKNFLWKLSPNQFSRVLPSAPSDGVSSARTTKYYRGFATSGSSQGFISGEFVLSLTPVFFKVPSTHLQRFIALKIPLVLSPVTSFLNLPFCWEPIGELRLVKIYLTSSPILVTPKHQWVVIFLAVVLAVDSWIPELRADVRHSQIGNCRCRSRAQFTFPFCSVKNSLYRYIFVFRQEMLIL